MKLGKVSQANWGREEERAGQNSCGQQGAGSACRKGRAGCQREKLRPRGNTRSTRRVRSERASSLWVLGSPSGSEAPRGLHTRSCQGAAAQGTSADLLAYLWAVKTASADSPVPFPLSRHSVENSSASVPPFSITPQCNHVKNVKKVYFYCYYESQRRRKKKKIHCRGESCSGKAQTRLWENGCGRAVPWARRPLRAHAQRQGWPVIIGRLGAGGGERLGLVLRGN